MIDDKYKVLQENYKKKCARVKKLIKENYRLKEEKNWYQEYGETAEKYRILCNSIGQQYYKISYQAKNKMGNMFNFTETLKGPHAFIVEREIRTRNYLEYKFVSIEKI